MSDPAPTVLNDRYELRDLIGRGGMAEVYRGIDRTLDREVAVKIMLTVLGGDVERRRFAAETRMMASLNHAHLVTVLDAGLDDVGGSPRPWLVMELVEGPTLSRRVADGPPLTAGDVAAIGADIATALAHVHAHGIVHRDVKPANILLTAGGAAKLADFGVARLTAEQSDLTGTGHTIGTAAYLAPEQVNGQPVNGACDVYALGLVLLEALTGRRVYEGSPTEAAFARLHRSPLIPVSLGAAWVQLLDAMTASDPGGRPSASDVAARLAALRAGRLPGESSVSAGLDPTGTMAFPSASSGEPSGSAALRKYRRPLVAGAALALAGMVGLGVVWVSDGGSDSAPPAGAVAQLPGTPLPGKSPGTGAPETSPPTSSSTAPAHDTHRAKNPTRHPGHKAKKHTAPKHHGKKHRHGHGKRHHHRK